MRHFFEEYMSANEDWMCSAVYMNIRNSSRRKRQGKYCWKRFCDLVQEPLGFNLVCTCSSSDVLDRSANLTRSQTCIHNPGHQNL